MFADQVYPARRTEYFGRRAEFLLESLRQFPAIQPEQFRT
jgi:hypothetical protein